MPIDVDLIDRLLALSEADRAELAHRLLLSLKPATTDNHEEYERAWAVEIERRVDKVDRGAVKMSSWADAELRIRKALRNTR